MNSVLVFRAAGLVAEIVLVFMKRMMRNAARKWEELDESPISLLDWKKAWRLVMMVGDEA